ncbi:MAG TPA: ABC transporter permease, partial [Gemmatimonadales bacterium]
MLRAFVRRALAGLAVVLGVVTLMFFLIRLAPGDPALLLVGPTATPEQLAAQRQALGLDRPIPQQYTVWLGRFVRGDWGSSIATGRPVRAMISAAWPATVSLVGLSLVLSYILGIIVGAV